MGNYGERLKKIRRELGLSQKEMAKNLGVHVQTLVKYERGERKIPLDLIESLSQLFGVNPTWVITGEGSMFKWEVPDVPGIEDEEREILAILREFPELKPLILKLLKGAKDTDEALQEIKNTLAVQNRLKRLSPEKT